MFEQLLLEFIAKHYREAAHSIFSPSGSHMWMTCPGALIPNLLAMDEAGFEAAEGTVAHECGEQWLKTGVRPSHRVGEIVRVVEGRKVFNIEITSEMLSHVEDYVMWCQFMPGTHFVEQKVFFSQYTPIPQQGGTADFFACQRHKLNITDLKFGQGIQVYAEENSQALLYALGVFLKWDWLYDFQEIEIRIAQPRRDHMDTWEIDRRTLLAFGKKVRLAARDAWRLNAPLRPSGKACQFCKVKANCPAFAKIAEDLSNEAFADITDQIGHDPAVEIVETVEADLFSPNLILPALLSTDDLAKVLPFRGPFEKWFAEIETQLEQRALEGQNVRGHKLVESRSNRVFKSFAVALDKMAEAGVPREKMYSQKEKSPAQAEELLHETGMKKSDAVKFLSGVVKKPPGKPVLVPLSDKRPAYQHPDDGVFDDL